MVSEPTFSTLASRPVLRRCLVIHRYVNTILLSSSYDHYCFSKTDHQLAVYGVEQSHQLAKFLISPSAHPDSPVPEAVFSSPFYRCIQTAEPTARALASYTEKPVSIKLEHGVQEW